MPKHRENELFYVSESPYGRDSSEDKKDLVLFEWEGYKETTWEPIESFGGSRYAVTQFWANADCGPRNPDQMSKFSAGEVIHLKKKQSTVRKTKPGPGRSSVGLITGTRVFALWPETQHYYSAVVQKRAGAGSYVVRFDEDESEFTVALKHMRPCEDLREGDIVILKTDSATVSKLGNDGSLVVKKKVDYSTITLSAYDVEEQWDDRVLSHSDIVCSFEK
ncbi:hypothetical protein C8R45DRAFT_1078764 [Mycena sanguinolenta]|nr:hypothetical protein C8R45DRAFT_1078764 [Mycena sanguinolenta]